MSDQSFDAKYNPQRVHTILNSTVPVSVADELEKLYSLKEKGVLTEAEFKDRKSKLL